MREDRFGYVQPEHENKASKCRGQVPRRKRILFGLPLLVAAGLFAVLFFPSLASAHEREIFKIGNQTYLVEIGTLNEPVVVDDKTGVDLTVKTADPADPANFDSPNAKPVLGLEKSLKAEVSAGSKKRTFNLDASDDTPGEYTTTFYPTVQTTLSIRIFGTINSVPVDFTVGCLPEGSPEKPDNTNTATVSPGVVRTLDSGSFGCPVAKADLGFPEPSTTLRDLAGAQSASANASWSGSAVLGIIAIIISVIAVGISIGALLKRKK